MPRTRNRPFVTGVFQKSPLWILFILLLLVVGSVPTALIGLTLRDVVMAMRLSSSLRAAWAPVIPGFRLT